MVADYIKETGNHVLYRAIPIFEGENLVASGVVMEALSVEDEGEGVCFHVYVYNVQPGVEIDYATGESWETGDSAFFRPGESGGRTGGRLRSQHQFQEVPPAGLLLCGQHEREESSGVPWHPGGTHSAGL